MCQLINQINVKLFADQFELRNYPASITHIGYISILEFITHKLLYYFILNY